LASWFRRRFACRNACQRFGHGALTCVRHGSHDESLRPDSFCYAIRPISDKGLGAVAVRNIACGTMVIEETPSILFAFGSAAEESVRNQFHAHSALEKETIMALQTSRADTKATLHGIIKNNGVGVRSNIHDCALCVTISRFNHSCAPNCEHSWHETLGKVRLYATRDVLAGEELTYSYINPFLSRAQRLRQLQDHWGFTCACKACHPVNMAGLTVSDSRRVRVAQHLRKMKSQSFLSLPVGNRASRARETLQLLDEEGLGMMAYRSYVCSDAFQRLLAWGCLRSSLQWAEAAYVHSKTCRGEDHPDTLTLKSFADNPMRQPAAFRALICCVVGVSFTYSFAQAVLPTLCFFGRATMASDEAAVQEKEEEEEERPHCMGDVMADDSLFRAELADFDAKAEADALHTLFSDDSICAICASKLSAEKWQAAISKFDSWKDSDPAELGAAIQAVVDHLDAVHLQPSSIVERISGGVDAAAFGVATLMQNLAEPAGQRS